MVGLNNVITQFIYDHILLIYDIDNTGYGTNIPLWIYYNIPDSTDTDYEAFRIENKETAYYYIQLVLDLQKDYWLV